MIPILAGALLSLAAACGLGRAVWRFRSPHPAFTLAAGAPLLALAVYFLLLFHLASPALLIALCAALALLLLPAFHKPQAHRPVLAALALIPFFLYYLIHALAPEIQPDAVTYHLGLVAEWLRLHAFSPRIGFYEMLPLGFETLFLPAFAVGAHSAAKLVHFAFLCATAPLIVRLAARYGLSPNQAWAAFALYALTPVVAITATSAYNDAALVFFLLAAFALLEEDHPAAAGLAAGFAFAIKITGGLAVLGGLAWLLARRRLRPALAFSLTAALSILPWTLRNLWLTGNPLAPLANSLFPNDFFHAFTEARLSEYLSHYGGQAPLSRLPYLLTIDGELLQGLLGPAFLLIPLALLAVRKRAAWPLLAAAALFFLPYSRNVGTRFLLPALPFLTLALACAIPRQALFSLLALHALSVTPWALDRYSGSGSWRLHGLPWQAALRLQPEQEYLSKNLWGYDFTRQVNTHMASGGRLLDLYGLPSAYLHEMPVGPHSSAEYDNDVRTLMTGADDAPDTLYRLRARFPETFLRGLRVRLLEARPVPFSLAEVQLFRAGSPRPALRNWFLSSNPIPGDAWLALDGNRSTRWSSLENGQPGMCWQLTFDRPIPLDAADLVFPTLEYPSIVAVEAQALDKSWRPLEVTHERLSERFYRRSPVAFLKRQGIRFIAARVGGEGLGPLGQSLLDVGQAWGVELVERSGDIALFRIL